jgi:hypothetical protein
MYVWYINSAAYEYGGVCTVIAESLEEAQAMAMQAIYADSIDDIKKDPDIYEFPCVLVYGE